MPAENSGGPQHTPLLDWAIQIMVREMRQRLHGHVAVHMHDGKILRVEVKKTEVPEPQSA